MLFIPLFHLRVPAIPPSFQVNRSLHFSSIIFSSLLFPLVGDDDFPSLLFPLVGDDDFSLLVLCDFFGVDDDDDGCFSVVVVAFAFSVDALVTFLMDFAVAAFVGGTSVVF